MGVYVVRADYGTYTEDFVDGSFVAIGWLNQIDLSDIAEDQADEIKRLYEKEYPDKSKMHVAQSVGQIYRFLHEIQENDYVITPAESVEELYYGKIKSDYYHEEFPVDCPYRHRKQVEWEPRPILRSSLSIPMQNTIKSSLTVFYVKHENDFFEAIGKKTEKREIKIIDFQDVILKRILQLSAEEFEYLVSHLLTVIGFEAEHTGRTGDDGIDAKGELNIYNMAKIDLVVQAKRYSLNKKIQRRDIKAFRASIPEKSQGCFITTCSYAKNAREEAIKPGFKRIGTIDGQQLVDILVEEYEKLPTDMKEKLKLRKILWPE